MRVHDFVQPGRGQGHPLRGVRPGDQRAGSASASTMTRRRLPWRPSADGGSRWGLRAYPHARRLLITADGGGSNSSRARLWKVELQQLADELACGSPVCHFPPGTSKWNKIEHRLFVVHQPELARPPAGQPRSHREPDCRHDHDHRSSRPVAPRYPVVSRRPQGQPAGRGRPGASPLTRFTETGTTPFSPLAKQRSANSVWTIYFVTSP